MDKKTMLIAAEVQAEQGYPFVVSTRACGQAEPAGHMEAFEKSGLVIVQFMGSLFIAVQGPTDFGLLQNLPNRSYHVSSAHALILKDPKTGVASNIHAYRTFENSPLVVQEYPSSGLVLLSIAERRKGEASLSDSARLRKRGTEEDFLPILKTSSYALSPGDTFEDVATGAQYMVCLV